MLKKLILIILIIPICVITYFYLEIANSDKNFAKYAHQVVLPDGMQPLRVIRTNEQGTYMVLTTDRTFLLYSINGKLLDTYKNSDTTIASYFILSYIDSLQEIIYITNETWDSYPYRDSKIYGIKIDDSKIKLTERPINSVFKKLWEFENTSNPNISLKNHCVSIDVVYGTCLLNYVTISANYHKIFLWDKKLQHSLQIYDKTIILVSNVEKPKTDSYEAKLYLLDTALKQQSTK